MDNSDDSTVKRIEKDISMFYGSVQKVNTDDKKLRGIVELSGMYAKDAKSYLDKGDLYTAFSCISYAHGLLDAVKEVLGIAEEHI